MDIIDKVAAKLASHPNARVVRDAHSIRVLPFDQNGFEIALIEEDRACSIHFEGWHEDFDDSSQALDCFAFGLFGPARLEITYRGDFPVHWALQSQNGGDWETDSSVGLLLSPFWQQRKTVHKSNLGRGDISVLSLKVESDG